MYANMPNFSSGAAGRPSTKTQEETFMDEAWGRVCKRLRAELGEDIFNSWLARLELDQIADGVACCSVPTKFLKSWIHSHFIDGVNAAIRSEYPEVKRTVVSVRSVARNSAIRTEKPSAELAGAQGFSEAEGQRLLGGQLQIVGGTSGARDPNASVAAFTGLDDRTGDSISGSPLDRRFTFDTFLVGSSNELAFAAAQRVANSKSHDGLPYNPLYFHASVGLGKTHLLQAVTHQANVNGRRVIYMTAEYFMYRFVNALKAQTAIAFKEKIRGIDMLIIDDVQFLNGKQMQQEFGHTINALIDAGRQVIVAADRPPAELETFDERVRSRLSGGLCVEINGFDEALRLKVVEARIEAARQTHPDINVPADVVHYVAKVINTNGRDLDGAVNRLIAHATFTTSKLTLENAENAIRDLVRSREPKRVKIEDILKLVANHYSVSRPDILSSRRTANVVRPRQIAMYLAKTLTLRSLPEIGRRFGGRDHTTVLHAVRKIDAQAQKDAALRDELDLLKRMLLE